MKFYLIVFVVLFSASYSFAQESISPAKPGTTYGKQVTANNTIKVTDLPTKLSSSDAFTGKIEGKVVEVCKKKGCFMKIAQENGEPIMVNFTGYSFFMPQDIVGKTVVVEGTAKKKETSVERLQHFAQDAGKSKEEIAKITKPTQEIAITADGVLVVK